MNARRAFLEAIAILAAPAEAQVAWLASIGTGRSADELALEFDDWYRLIPQLSELGMVSAGAAELADGVSAALSAIPKAEWSDKSLANAPAWERVRRSAGLALVALMECSPEPRTVYVHAGA
jgi:hypothetical protein